jgi:hypothetical protein
MAIYVSTELFVMDCRVGECLLCADLNPGTHAAEKLYSGFLKGIDGGDAAEPAFDLTITVVEQSGCAYLCLFFAVQQRWPRHSDFLLPLLLAVRLSGNPGDRSRRLPRIGKKDRLLKGVGQHRQVCLGQRKDSGRILEAAGSTSDLKGKSTVCLESREIYAIASLCEIDLQQTPIQEAKYARAGNTWKIKLIWARAGAGRLRSSIASPDITKGEWA